MDMNQATRNKLNGQDTSLEDDDIDAGSPAARPGAVDLKAIREAIARVEAEAKATVAAENRAHAEAHPPPLAQNHARP